MPQLTWRNVDAPNFGGVTDSLALMGQMMNKGFDSAQGVISGIQQDKTRSASNEAILRALGARDNATLQQGLSDGSLLGDINPNYLSADALKVLGDRGGTLLQNQTTDLANQKFDYNFRQDQSHDAAKPAADALIAEVSKLAVTDPKAAQERLASGSGTLSAAGYGYAKTVEDILGNSQKSTSARSGVLGYDRVVDDYALDDAARQALDYTRANFTNQAEGDDWARNNIRDTRVMARYLQRSGSPGVWGPTGTGGVGGGSVAGVSGSGGGLASPTTPSVNNRDGIIDYIIDDFEGGDKYVAQDGRSGAGARFGINGRANPDVDLKSLSRSGAKDIYVKRYWDKINGDKILEYNPALAFTLMDAAVNQGVGAAQEMYKAARTKDGQVDVTKFNELRRQRYARTQGTAQEKESWANRLSQAENVAQEHEVQTSAASTSQAAQRAIDSYLKGQGYEQDRPFAEFVAGPGRPNETLAQAGARLNQQFGSKRDPKTNKVTTKGLDMGADQWALEVQKVMKENNIHRVDWAAELLAQNIKGKERWSLGGMAKDIAVNAGASEKVGDGINLLLGKSRNPADGFEIDRSGIARMAQRVDPTNPNGTLMKSLRESQTSASNATAIQNRINQINTQLAEAKRQVDSGKKGINLEAMRLKAASEIADLKRALVAGDPALTAGYRTRTTKATK